ncbi:MAG: UDP-N-acetylmuramoyl-tripeptide--D-alanyl-D-alanine ligase [Parvicellaceae bacterium]
MVEQVYNAFLSCDQKVTTDTRNIAKNDLFFALKGPNFNGNKFAEKALELGAKYAVIDEKEYFIEGKTFLVENVLETLQSLARFHREKINIPVVAITGTNGKTTTKELLGAVLTSQYHILITKGNLNNHIGVPLTILQLNKEHEIAVIEMGASKIGDIKELVEIALPNYGIITNIGKAHLEGFGDVETIKKTKFELYDFIIENKGAVVVNKEDEVLLSYIPKETDKFTYGSLEADVIGKVVRHTPTLEMELSIEENAPNMVKTNLLGAYNQNNILAAACVGKLFKVSKENIEQSIANYLPTNNRSQLVTTSKNTVIADCYNANPTSTMESLISFNQIESSQKLVILGDMLELGSASEVEHQAIVDYLENTSLKAILVGTCYQKTNSGFTTFKDTLELIPFLKQKGLENSLVLLKGSRGIKLEMLLKENIF